MTGHERSGVSAGLTPGAYAWMVRGVPLSIAAAVVAVLTTSNVPLNLWAIRGTPAAVLAGCYAALLVVVAIRPLEVELHLIGGPLAVAVFLGRGGGFLELALARNDWSLVAAIAERVSMCVVIAAWHAYMTYLAGLAGVQRYRRRPA